MTSYFYIMCFGYLVHALMDSNIASRLSILMGPICMVNFKETCWSQWKPTLMLGHVKLVRTYVM